MDPKGPQFNLPVALLTYGSFAVLVLIGHLRDILGAITGYSRYADKTRKPGYSALFSSWESFYTRRLYHRIQDCWNRPICSAPASRIEVMCTRSIECINTGSYNYLGFADDWKTSCRAMVMPALAVWPLSTCSARMDCGSHILQEQLEQTVARFVGQEAALVFGMGYDTNASVIPALMSEGTLILSDALNHISIVNGSRAAGAHIIVFNHNDPMHLEELLCDAIVRGQPRHHRPWRKVLVMVEGIYSMEGDICRLREIVAICKRYKAYLYVDEAHSIGALGSTGRGVCEHCGVDPKDVDILMGTFTKSVSSMGGYIAASHEVIAAVRATCHAMLFHCALSPVLCQQILAAFSVIQGHDGTDTGAKKLTALRENSQFFRREMLRIGLHVYGEDGSPIVPVLFYIPCKMAAFSRECLCRGVAVVVVGFPATSAHLGRARFCISAGHSKADLIYTVQVIEEVADMLNLRYSHRWLG